MNNAPGSIDVHVHPAGDPLGLHVPVAEWVAALAATALDVVVVTDHNAVDMLERLRDLLGDRGPELVRGEEIATREGHLLGLGIDRLVPAGLALRDAVAAVHDVGGLAIVAHPLLPSRISISSASVRRLAEAEGRHRPDGIEAFNPLAARFPFQERRARELAAHLGLAVVGGSDAHRPRDLGTGRTRYPGRSFADFRRSVTDGLTSTEGDTYPLGRTIREGLGAVLSSRFRLRF